LAYAILALGRGTQAIGALKMALSLSGRLLNVTSSSLKESSWELPVTVATVVVG
jgi:hypothetical protein